MTTHSVEQSETTAQGGMGRYAPVNGLNLEGRAKHNEVVRGAG